MEALGKIKTLKEYGNPFLAGGTFGEVCIAIQSEEIAKNDEKLTKKVIEIIYIIKINSLLARKMENIFLAPK